MTAHSYYSVECKPTREAVLGWPEPARRTDQPITVSVYQSWEALEETFPEWEDILQENQDLSIFSTPEWIGSWWKAFGSNRQMLTLGFRGADHQLVGIAPLFIDELRYRFGKIRCLRLIGDGSGDSDNIDFIIRPGFEKACAQGLFAWLESQRSWHTCWLNMLPQYSKVARTLVHHLSSEKWALTLDHVPNAAINLPETWSSFVESLAPKFQPLVTRYPRRLASRHRVRFCRCESADELSRCLAVLFLLHQKRWNHLNESGSFESLQRRKFYEYVSHAFLMRNWLELWHLEVDGVVVAAQFCFRYRDTAYILQEGFDPNFSREKVGYVLRGAMIRHFIESGIHKYDFLGGFNAHKQSWGARPGFYTVLTFARPRSIGSSFLLFKKTAKEAKKWLREHLPSPLWSILRWGSAKLYGMFPANPPASHLSC
jgi:CelD/BcsL family acetyltransferase involved in cellulose biosynthesis